MTDLLKYEGVYTQVVACSIAGIRLDLNLHFYHLTQFTAKEMSFFRKR